MALPTERFWDDLLLYIDDGKVVPVLGPELCVVADAGRNVPLRQWLAGRMVQALRLPIDALPKDCDLNDVVALHLREGGERDDLYARLLQLLREAPPAASPALQALASIAPLNLYVTLGFDSLLADALALARPGSDVRSLAYSPNAVRDLPGAASDLTSPLVFHLFGRASSTPDYAICDDDLLEFLHALQDGQRRPVRLFDALRSHHLLILGAGFDDWLARFFLRTARGLELGQKRKRWDVLADAGLGQATALTMFLTSFSTDTKLLELPAADFALTLAQRWHAAHQVQKASAAPSSSLGPSTGPREGAVFVSYARKEDAAPVRRLVEGLRAAGLDVWFDEHELMAGGHWSLAIQRGIEACALFLPVISRASTDPGEGRRYFWREWNLADELARGMAPQETFIVPVVVDDTRLDRVEVFDSFRRKQACIAPGGELDAGAAQRFTDLVRAFHRRRGAA